MADQGPPDVSKLDQVLEYMRVIAEAVDPYTTSQLGIGISSQRVAGSDGPRRHACTGAAQVLAKANQGRRGLAIYFEGVGSDVLYVSLTQANAATVSNYTIAMVSGSYYEVPGPPFYAGEVSAICSAAEGAVLVTEMS